MIRRKHSGPVRGINQIARGIRGGLGSGALPGPGRPDPPRDRVPPTGSESSVSQEATFPARRSRSSHLILLDAAKAAREV